MPKIKIKMSPRSVIHPPIHPSKSAKATMQLSIASAMMGVLFFVLTLILATGSDKFNFIALAQLVLAVPMLYMASLGHSKTAYRKDEKHWHTFAWFTSNSGNIMILNAIGLMVMTVSRNLSATYFLLIIALMVIYSLINIYYNPAFRQQKVYKLTFFMVLVFFGGILPLLLS